MNVLCRSTVHGDIVHISTNLTGSYHQYHVKTSTRVILASFNVTIDSSSQEYTYLDDRASFSYAVIKGVLRGHTVAMVTYCVTKMITTCSLLTGP